MNWHEGEDESGVMWDRTAEPLPLSAPARGPIAQDATSESGPSRLKLLLLGAVIGIALGLLLLGALLLWRANQGNQLVRRDVTAAAALLQETQAAGDVQRYAELLDGTDPVWKARLVAGLRAVDNSLPAQWNVARVRLQDDMAEAEVTTGEHGGATLHRVIFFRLNSGQWRLAPPTPQTFGDEQQTTAPHFRVHYRERDQRFVAGVVNQAEGAYVALCGELRCTDSSRLLDLRLAYDGQADAPGMTPGVVSVASPSLAGWTPSGQPGTTFTQQLVRQIAAQMAQRKVSDASQALLELIGDWAAADLAGAFSPVEQTLAEALRSGDLLPLYRAWGAVVRGNSNNALARAELASMLNFVQSTWGSDAVGLLLENASRDLDTVTRRAFQVDSRTFQQMWLDWLAQQHSPPPGTSTG